MTEAAVLRPKLVVAAQCALGEGPHWSVARQTLYWVDIAGRAVHSFRPSTEETRRIPLDLRPTALAEHASGDLLLATDAGLADLDLDTGQLTLRRVLEPERPGNRPNDGKCDPQGRFWIGTMDDAERGASGALYRYDPDGNLTRHVDGVGISNTLAWSPDGRIFYFADSATGTIYAYAFDTHRGLLSHRRVFAQVAPPGAPDGSTIDAEGCLWNCEWDGWRVVRYRPDGVIDRILSLPVARPTSCAFGGPELGTLYITTARIGLGDADLARQPDAGGVWSVDPGVRGLPEPHFGG